MAGNDRNVGDAPDRVADVNQKPAESTLLQDVMQGTSRNEQLAFARSPISEGQKEELTAPFKSKDGKDCAIVNKDGSEYKGEYKPAETVEGEIKVQTTLGNDTQWKVDLPEVGKKVEDAPVRDARENRNAIDDGAAEATTSAGKAEHAAADKEHDGKAGEDTEKEGHAAGDADGQEKNLEAAETHQGSAEAGAEVGKELGEETHTKQGAEGAAAEHEGSASEKRAAESEKQRQASAIQETSVEYKKAR